MAVSARAFTSTSNFGWGFDAFGMALSVGFDVVTVQASAPGIALSIVGVGANEVPADPQRNTAGLALAALLERHALDRGLSVKIHKGIRHGSGMGSSAASAAAAIFAANAELNLNLTPQQMIELAAEGERASAGSTHADNVAPAILGGFTIVDNGPPLNVTRYDVPGDLQFVMATPSIHVATSVARQRMPKDVTLSIYSRGAARSGVIVAAILKGDSTALGHAIEGSFTDEARGPLIPAFDEVRAAAKSAGASGVTISGAGPTVMAVVGPGGHGDDIARGMCKAFRDAGLDCDARIARAAPGAALVEGLR